MSTKTRFEKPDLAQARAGSWYTILGAGGDLDEWVEGYTEAMQNKDIGTPVQWYRTTGADLNQWLKPTVFRDWFPADLVVLMFPLDGLDVGKLAMLKLVMGDRWFDDVVSNTRSRTAWL